MAAFICCILYPVCTAAQVSFALLITEKYCPQDTNHYNSAAFDSFDFRENNERCLISFPFVGYVLERTSDNKAMKLECVWTQYCRGFFWKHQHFLWWSWETFTHSGQLPLHSLVLQTSQIFHRPSVITMQLYCILLSSSQTHFMIRSATLLLLKWYQLLIMSDFWDTLPDQIFCWLSNTSVSLTVRPIVHLFLIDTQPRG